jgi:hypothetical protein
LAIVVQPYLPEHEPAVAEFNQRLQAGGAEKDLVFYERATPRWLPADGSPIFNQYFVATENGAVRGGYALKWQDFWFADGHVRSIGYYHHPLSEGIVNKAYAIVGTLLLRDAMQRAPLLYCLGMGGYDRPLPKMLIGLGWNHFAVPFYFRVVNAFRFLREMQPLRSSRRRKLAADVAAFSGAGTLGLKARSLLASVRAPTVAPFEVAEVSEYGAWTDALWSDAKTSCSMTAVRDGSALQRLYPADQQHLTRLRISRNGADLGWAVVGERRKDAKYGKLRVGSIVDCWASAGNALAVVGAAYDKLEATGMNLIVSNQSHRDWRAAFEASGFMSSESNFIFAASKKLSALLQPFDELKLRLHFTRADGDGLPRNF